MQNDGALVASAGLDSFGRIWDLRTGLVPLCSCSASLQESCALPSGVQHKNMSVQEPGHFPGAVLHIKQVVSQARLACSLLVLMLTLE
jgi:hypothetical protein